MQQLGTFVSPPSNAFRKVPKNQYIPSLVTHSNYRRCITTSSFETNIFASPGIDDGVLSNEDIFIGTILALILAFLFSFLQGKTPSSSNIILWRNEESNDLQDLFNAGTKDKVYDNYSDKSDSVVKDYDSVKENVFDGDMWKEMSRPENYAVYTREKVQSNNEMKSESKDAIMVNQNKSNGKRENKLVLISLLILFVPIFSVEFFFALSRQFICGDYVTNVDDTLWILDAKKAAAASNGSSPWAAKLCSPANIMNQ